VADPSEDRDSGEDAGRSSGVATAGRSPAPVIATYLVASDVRLRSSILRVRLSRFEPVTRGIGNVTCADPHAKAGSRIRHQRLHPGRPRSPRHPSIAVRRLPPGAPVAKRHARRLGMSHTIVHRHPCASRLQVGPRVDDNEVVVLAVQRGTGGKH
jgi:hypothetical protein